jgi:hypothetical protein
MVALAALLFCNTTALGQSFNNWNDLSDYFNLNTIYSNGSSYSFNTYDLTSGCWTFSNELVSGEYHATVLGTNVWLRRYPEIAQHTQLCKVNTGDRLVILDSGIYGSGKYWNRIRIQAGEYAGWEAYVCSDFVIDYNMYSVLCNYVFSRSNMSVANKSQHLNAIAAILIKLGVDSYSPYNINVTKLSTNYNELIAFRITNSGLSYNNSMLAVVKCSSSSNDYQVVAIVPGRYINYITRLSNGSYNISYGK